jgi:threonylcarbamoyladenosine tRNA methylthiotransferase MtaB
MTTVATAFVGCKVSQADGEAALAALAAGGLRAARDTASADLVVVHTCCVTAEAERKSRRLVCRCAAEGRRVIVAGCAAALRPEQFEAPGVEVAAHPDWAAVAAAAPAASPSAPSPALTRERTRFVLKVQDGCAGVCSYCVVRLVRGRPRGTPLAAALDAARAALAGGCGEVVLSGVDLGAWRDGARRLPELVGELVALPSLRRLRLSSVEPRHLDDGLLAALAHPKVARHLHMPLQSADDAVLAAMRRPYTFAGYLATARRVRARIGGGMLSTDVIVGFPTEDERAFARTLEALESGLFGRAHVFAFSPRPGTAAAELPPLPAAQVKERMRRALAAAEAAARAARLASLGRPAEVLVEERREGAWRGYSSEYVRYCLDGEARPGELVRAVGVGLHEDGVKGRIA